MLLSACNDEMTPDPVDNLGYEIACKTYGSPREATGNLNLARYAAFCLIHLTGGLMVGL